MAVTKIYLIRHAEAEGNLYRRLHGWYDSLITENGYQQIKALEERFRDIPVDAVYSSDLFRTKTTASAIYKPKGLELQTRRDLREMYVGEWEDVPFSVLARTEPDEFARFNNNDPAFQCEGSETFGQVRERVGNAILDIARKHPGQSVAIVSHGVAIRNTLARFWGYKIEEIKDKSIFCGNTGIALIEVENDTPNVVYYNDHDHLPEELMTFARQHRGKTKRENINLWFRPLDMERESQFYYKAREEAWLNIHGSMLHFDGEGFLQDAKDQARYDERSVLQVMLGDEPAGLLQLNLRQDADKGVGSIPFYYMMPEYRMRGMGVQLLGQAVSIYRPMGRKYLRLRCAPDNHVAQRFYKRYGFEKIGEDPGSRVPLDILEKHIGYET